MKTKHFTLFFLTVFLLGYILFILYFFTSLQVVKNDIRQKQCLALKETIEEDYQMRLKQVSLIDWSKGNQKKIKTYNKASKEGPSPLHLKTVWTHQ